LKLDLLIFLYRTMCRFSNCVHLWVCYQNFR
jgi:hypothetical protein